MIKKQKHALKHGETTLVNCRKPSEQKQKKDLLYLLRKWEQKYFNNERIKFAAFGDFYEIAKDNNKRTGKRGFV